jgi:hypothetical protein
MPKATSEAITLTRTANIGLTPVGCKYVAANEVLVSLADTAGQITTFTLTTDSMMDLTNRMVAVVQNFTAQVLRDLRATEAAATYPTGHPNPDALLFVMVHRHDEVQDEMNVRLREGDPRIPALSAESVELAHRILMFPVVTNKGLTEKKRIVEIEGIEVDSNHVLFKTGQDFVQFIYGQDAGRIAAVG